ncbi:MAG: hypothetical protein JWO98_5312 [Frankiales bacterium]|nr:hypothetical protein [Frankiales bacterium]
MSNIAEIVTTFNALPEDTELAPEFLAEVNRLVKAGVVGMIGNDLYEVNPETFDFVAVFSRRDNEGEGDTRHREYLNAPSLTDAFARCVHFVGFGDLVGIVRHGERITF